MDVSPNELRRQTIETLRNVDKHLNKLELERGAQVPTGVVGPLLLAKAQCLNTLVLLNEPRK